MTGKQSLPLTEQSTTIRNCSNKYKGESKMNTSRKIAITVGVLYLTANFIAGPLGLLFTEPTLNAPDYLVQVSANETQMLIGALLVLVMAVADAGIGIVVYPVLKKRNASIAIGYFGARIVESLIFVITAISLLLLLTLSHGFVQAGAPDNSHFQTLGEMLLAVRDWAGHVVLDVAVFPLGALLFYYVLYQSRLVPRWLSGWGLVGAILSGAAGLLVMFSLITPLSTIQVVLQAPVGLQEIALALWLIIKGFNPSAIASGSAA
jgi:hypothetical protein